MLILKPQQIQAIRKNFKQQARTYEFSKMTDQSYGLNDDPDSVRPRFAKIKAIK